MKTAIVRVNLCPPSQGQLSRALLQDFGHLEVGNTDASYCVRSLWGRIRSSAPPPIFTIDPPRIWVKNPIPCPQSRLLLYPRSYRAAERQACIKYLELSCEGKATTCDASEGERQRQLSLGCLTLRREYIRSRVRASDRAALPDALHAEVAGRTPAREVGEIRVRGSIQCHAQGYPPWARGR